MRNRGPSITIRLVAVWLLLLYLLLPVFMTIPYSLTSTDYLAFPKDGLSLAPYFNLFNSEEWYESLVDSLVVASGAAGLQ